MEKSFVGIEIIVWSLLQSIFSYFPFISCFIKTGWSLTIREKWNFKVEALSFWPLNFWNPVLFTNIQYQNKECLRKWMKWLLDIYFFKYLCYLPVKLPTFISLIMSIAFRTYQLFLKLTNPQLYEVKHFQSNSTWTRHSSGRWVGWQMS